MSLRGRDRFERVMAEGVRARSGPVAVTVAPASDPLGALRLGLAVSGRVGAVRRNRIRRRLREAARASGLHGRDIVVGADTRALGVGFQELVEDLRRAVARAEARR